MARSTVRLLLTVVLALLCNQTAMLPADLAAEYEAIFETGPVQSHAEQQLARTAQFRSIGFRELRRALYISLLRVGTDTLLVFQLPPPVFPLQS